MTRCHLGGEVDMANVPTYEAELMGHLGTDPHLVVDCTDLTFIDSSGLNMLVRVRNAARQCGGDLVVRNVNDDCRRTFEVAALAELLLEPND
jgi:anti-sigma B factor antagonist